MEKGINLIRFFFSNNKLPLFIATTGVIFPYLVYSYCQYQVDRLNRGIPKDMERIKLKGKRLSDIPQSKY